MKQVPLADMIRRTSQAVHMGFLKQEPTLTLPQTVILRSLLQRGPMNHIAISGATGVDKSTLAEILSRMQTAGLIVRVRMEHDKRALLVSLTPAGRAQLMHNLQALDAVERQILRRIPRPLRIAFQAALTILLEGET